MAKTTSFALNDELERFLRTEVAEGRYSNASEVVREALRRMMEYKKKRQELERLIDEGVSRRIGWKSAVGSLAVVWFFTSSAGVQAQAVVNAVDGQFVCNFSSGDPCLFVNNQFTGANGIAFIARSDGAGTGIAGYSLSGTGVLGYSSSGPATLTAGVVGMNQTPGGYGVYGRTWASGNGAAIYGDAGGSSTAYAGYFWGQVRASSYSTSSDARLKTEIENLTYGLHEVSRLRPVTYKWKEETPSQRKQLGLIAQEVERVLPELVQGDPSGMLSINYQALIPVVVKALQEQQAIMKKQEARIAAIESQQSTAYSSMSGLALGLLPLGLFAAWRGRREPAVRRI